ncbi:hypothetical protein V8C34DRAFT_280686 [Trichoderma compactum]
MCTRVNCSSPCLIACVCVVDMYGVECLHMHARPAPRTEKNQKPGESSRPRVTFALHDATPCEPWLSARMLIKTCHRLPSCMVLVLVFRQHSVVYSALRTGQDELPDWACTSLSGWRSICGSLWEAPP